MDPALADALEAGGVAEAIPLAQGVRSYSPSTVLAISALPSSSTSTSVESGTPVANFSNENVRGCGDP